MGKKPPKQNVRYGTWRSAISAEQVAAGTVRVGPLDIRRDCVSWLEGRPSEKGRTTLIGCALPRDPSTHNGLSELVPSDISIGSRVHEYGGGAVFSGEYDSFFIHQTDQDIYQLTSERIIRITEAAGWRFADGCVDQQRRHIYAIAEYHPDNGPPTNQIARIPYTSPPADPLVIASGADFYAAPTLSPDDRHLAWLEWDLPHMPWQAARLMVASLAPDGSILEQRHIAGDVGAAAFQPSWDRRPGPVRLLFVWQRDEWSGLYQFDGENITPIFEPEGELLRPLWSLATRSYAQFADGRLLCCVTIGGEHRLFRVHPDPRDRGETAFDDATSSGTVTEWPLPCRFISDLVADRQHPTLYAVVQNDLSAPAVISLSPDGNSPPRSEILYPQRPDELDHAHISVGEKLVFETEQGDIHALHYPPTHAETTGLPNSLPPLIIWAHGGPTGHCDRGLKWKTQFWTNRGFAVLDVDYRGSTGYGATYRKALDQHWGMRDADDIIAAAKSIIADGKSDPDKLVIYGSSAGGYTALMALTRSTLFKAGCIAYGVSDIASLIATTHKFEAGYMDSLIGDSCDQDLLRARSPLHQADAIQCPLLFLQGTDDKVVPPSQSQQMVQQLRRRGITAHLIEYPGEGHGFRQAATIAHALQAEYQFYRDILKL